MKGTSKSAPQRVVVEKLECKRQKIRNIYVLYEEGLRINGNCVYSLEVTTETSVGKQSSAVRDITRDKERALCIVRLLSAQFVTACTLYDTLEDIL